MIDYFSEGVDLPVFNKQVFSNWIIRVVKMYNKVPGDICYIFCNDEYLLDVNRKYLNHNYYTDIITFNYNENEIVSGDLFISVDTVKCNAKAYNVEYMNEIKRVMVHGILHLIGFNDKTDQEKQQMRKEEDKALNIFKS